MILKGKEHNVFGCIDFTSVQWKASMRDVCQELVYTVVWPLCDVWTLLETLMLCMVLCSKVCFMDMYSLVRVMYGHYRRHFHLPIDVSPNIHWRSAWPELPLLVPHRNLYTEQIWKYKYKMKIIHCYHIRSSGWLLVFFPNTCFPAHVWLGVIHMTGFAD